MIKKTLVYLGLFALFLALPVSMFADSIVLGPTDFVPYTETITYYHSTQSLYIKNGSSGNTFFAPIHLPNGARITSAVIFYKDDSALCNIEVFFLKKNIYTLDNYALAMWTNSDDTSTVPLIHKMSPIYGGNIVNTGGYFYHMYIFFDDNTAGEDCAVYAVKINYK